MSITIQKGNAPLMNFTFTNRSGTAITLPSDTSEYTVKIRDSASERNGAGTIQNINTSAGTCQYQSASADTANSGTATWWIDVDLGEPEDRTFEPQKICVKDPSLV